MSFKVAMGHIWRESRARHGRQLRRRALLRARHRVSMPLQRVRAWC